MSRNAAAAIAGVLLLLQVAFSAGAETWPSRPIRLVVPFSPGGSTDITARVLAEGIRPLVGQTIVVDNRAGAAGNIAGETVARATPDGYTLLMASATLVTNMSLYKNLRYDFVNPSLT